MPADAHNAGPLLGLGKGKRIPADAHDARPFGGAGGVVGETDSC